MKILMVCLGNICRSPLAEGIMKDKIKSKNLNWIIDSAGTGAWHVGQRPDERSIRVADNHDINIKLQRARQFTSADFGNFDLILAMDSSNFTDLMQKANTPQEQEKIKLIMNFVNPGMNENVPDPYRNDDGFENVFEMLDRACEAVVVEMMSV